MPQMTRGRTIGLRNDPAAHFSNLNVPREIGGRFSTPDERVILSDVRRPPMVATPAGRSTSVRRPCARIAGDPSRSGAESR